MARGPSRRQQRIAAAFDELCDSVGQALGAAERLRDGAVSAHAEAVAELILRTEGLDAARSDQGLARLLDNPRLAGPVARVEADREAAFAGWLADGPGRLAGLLAEAAPGAAGADPALWLGRPGKADGTGRPPGLWRIGTGQIGARQIRTGLAGGMRTRPGPTGPALPGPGPAGPGLAAPGPVGLRKPVGEPSRGFPVAVPLLDESHLQISSTHDSRARAEALVEGLLMRIVSWFRPGMVALHVWDVGQFAGALPGLYPLTRTGLLTIHDPGRLPQLLEELSDRIRRVHTRVLVDGHPSLRALAELTHTRTEPWIVAVLLGNRSALREEDHRQLQRVARGGPACGVQLVLVDVPMTVSAPVETVVLRDDPAGGPPVTTSSMSGQHVTVELDPPLPTADVTDACHRISEAHALWRSRIGTFRDLLPEQVQWGSQRSVTGLHAPVGFADGLPVEMALADASPHALVGGPSGSGKTNLLLTMISSMAVRYDPDELEFYLLDFKEGVSFAQFAPGRRDTTWLPHARLVGVNINTDREFGLALLQFLADEMRRRAAAAKAHEVTKLEELRAADPAGHWPRIVAVIDEFQYLFAERDAVTRAATLLLEDVARRGRSQGIHLVLASQDVSGIEAFWGRPAIFEQFVLRIALPRARRVLADRNEATLDLPRWHAVLNHESGVKHGNEIVRIPDATAKGSVDEVQRTLYQVYAAGRPQPRLFDGSRSPRFAELVADLVPAGSGAGRAGGSGAAPPGGPAASPLPGGSAASPLPGGSAVSPAAGGSPLVLVGQCIDVAGSPATVALPDHPGRNLGVLAASATDAVRVLGAAAASLAGQFAPGGLEVVMAPLVSQAVETAQWVTGVLAGAGHAARTVAHPEVRVLIEQTAADVTARLSGGPIRPTYLVLFAADAADTVLDRAGTEALRKVLRFGPETGVHVLGWWRSVARLRTLLTLGASVDDLGAWVALDVQGSELGALAPGQLLSWSPRAGRGLFFDRAQHALPEVVIVPSLGDR